MLLFRSTPFERCTWRRLVIHAIGPILVVVGIGGELVFESLAFVEDNRQVREANLKIEDARKDAAAANERTEGERTARVKLQARILNSFGARTFDSSAASRVTHRLSGLSGVPVDVYAFAVGNPYTQFDDSKDLERALTHALSAAGIDAIGWVASGCSEAVGASNIVVNVAGLGGTPRSLSIPLAILDALKPEIATFPQLEPAPPVGDFCQIDPINPRTASRKPNATIDVLVGRRIPPVLTPELLGIDGAK